MLRVAIADRGQLGLLYPVHFPRYWAKASKDAADADGKTVQLACWRWSDASVEDAQQLAAAAAAALVETFATTGRSPDKYGYSDRPLREPVLRELRDGSGTVIAAVTRNAYGCEVLNTSGAMFIDIDFDQEEARSLLASLLQLFKKEPPEAPALARVWAFLNGHLGWGMRVYRTAAGLRILVTHAPIETGSAEAQEAFDAMRADPLYRRLCGLQHSYRARLTPKHWRCDVAQPPVSWPFADAARESAFEDWKQSYQRGCVPYATCALIRTLGNPTVHPDILPIVQLHDEATLVGQELPLA